MSASYTAFKCFCPRKMLMPLKKTSEPSGTFRNFTKLSAPSTTSPGICIGTLQNRQGTCTGTLRNLTSYLHLKPLEPQHGILCRSICTGTLRNLTRYLHRNPPEPQQVSAPEPSGTLQNFARNLVLKLHRIAPELIWAKDPIAKLCCWGKTSQH